MEGVKPDEVIRRPMQWSGEANAGFSTGIPWRAAGDNFVQYNVASESGDPDSLLSFYRTFISLRNQHSALKDGALAMISTDNTAVYAALRVDDSEAILTVVNLTQSPINSYNLNLQDPRLQDGSYPLKLLYGEGNPDGLRVDNHSLSNFKPIANLAAYGIYVFQIEP